MLATAEYMSMRLCRSLRRQKDPAPLQSANEKRPRFEDPVPHTLRFHKTRLLELVAKQLPAVLSGSVRWKSPVKWNFPYNYNVRHPVAIRYPFPNLSDCRPIFFTISSSRPLVP